MQTDPNYQALYQAIQELADHAKTGFYKPETVAYRIRVIAERMPAPAWRYAIFSIDGGESYQGWTKGQTWNGWAMPAFDYDTARKMLDDMCRPKDNTGMEYQYNLEGDALVVWMDINEEPDVYEGFDIIDEFGESRHVYAVGAGSWVWDEDREMEENE